MAELKKCPFCGGKIQIKKTDRYPRYGKYEGQKIDGYSPVCVNADCVIYDADTKYYYTEAEAVAAWNTRADDAELQQYQQAENDGRLVMLPCAINDTVYAVDSSPICELTVSHVGLYLDAGEEGDYAPLDDFGYIVFLTREEAKQALKEKQLPASDWAIKNIVTDIVSD